MPKTEVVFYREDDGSIPLLAWFDGLPNKVQDKCRMRIELLKQFGYELRRPVADILRDGIYELRVGFQGIHYRLLYFFHGKCAVALSHGVIKERVVPPKDIDRAVERKKKFERDPKRHTHQEGVDHVS
ncbi:MAG: type II toxin-antitoxin system RelE/ParE family toxin [Deltaproteobacteria bacterium]|nr:type II toxin-antitoxin system RelE/ParE family toxin [Deltaproteobacteria bacterium]